MIQVTILSLLVANAFFLQTLKPAIPLGILQFIVIDVDKE